MKMIATIRSHNAQSIGRKKEASTVDAGTSCPYYLVGDGDCTWLDPTLKATTGANTRFTFEPAGGDKSRFYIRQSVSAVAN